MEDMPKIKIRVANIHDLLPITIMWYKLNKEVFHDIFIVGEDEMKAFSHVLADRLLLPETFTMVAEDQDKVIGFTHGYLQHKLYYKPKTIGFSEFSYVEKPYRKKGIGKKLAVAFAKWARENGSEEIEFISKYDTKLIKQWQGEGCYPYAVIYREKDNKWQVS